MSHESPHLPNLLFPQQGPEPLPPEYGRELLALDAMLRREAEGRPCPPGLSERTFAASVTLLPKRSRRITAGAPMAAGRRSPQWWSRLSMAASVGLAFVIGSIFVRAPAEPAAEPSWYDVVASSDTASWLATDARMIEHEKIAYLLEVGSSDSLSHAAGELEMLVAELEM